MFQRGPWRDGGERGNTYKDRIGMERTPSPTVLLPNLCVPRAGCAEFCCLLVHISGNFRAAALRSNLREHTSCAWNWTHGYKLQQRRAGAAEELVSFWVVPALPLGRGQILSVQTQSTSPLVASILQQDFSVNASLFVSVSEDPSCGHSRLAVCCVAFRDCRCLGSAVSRG